MTHTISTNSGIKSIKFNGYKIELSTNIKNHPVARLSRFMTIGKNKGNYKLIVSYYFGTEERRKEWIKKRMEDIKANVFHKEQKKSIAKEARNNMVNPYKIGEIYYDSWGYDQTNVDFYEVVSIKEKSVNIQRIGSKMVEGTQGMDCSNVTPDPSRKIGEPETKIIQVRVWDNTPHYYIKSNYGSISKYDKGDRGVYCSWYH